jgi:hypothetical protein
VKGEYVHQRHLLEDGQKDGEAGAPRAVRLGDEVLLALRLKAGDAAERSTLDRLDRRARVAGVSDPDDLAAGLEGRVKRGGELVALPGTVEEQTKDAPCGSARRQRRCFCWSPQCQRPATCCRAGCRTKGRGQRQHGTGQILEQRTKSSARQSR